MRLRRVNPPDHVINRLFSYWSVSEDIPASPLSPEDFRYRYTVSQHLFKWAPTSAKWVTRSPQWVSTSANESQDLPNESPHLQMSHQISPMSLHIYKWVIRSPQGVSTSANESLDLPQRVSTSAKWVTRSPNEPQHMPKRVSPLSPHICKWVTRSFQRVSTSANE